MTTRGRRSLSIDRDQLSQPECPLLIEHLIQLSLPKGYKTYDFIFISPYGNQHEVLHSVLREARDLDFRWPRSGDRGTIDAIICTKEEVESMNSALTFLEGW